MGVISGPFEKSIGNGSGPHYRYQRWFRQTKPRDKPLPYFSRDQRVLKSGRDATFDATSYTKYPASSVFDAVANKCYSRFNQKLGEKASLSVSIAERKQAVEMIAGRAFQLYQFSRFLRKGQLGNAADALGVTKPKGVSRKKQFSQNYLEFHFGWSPLVTDIGNAVEVLQSGIPPPVVTAKASEPYSGSYLGPSSARDQWTGTVCQGMAARIRVDNPNLYLANQLGFVNPALVAWELVPFSFVVDWFVNVSDFLSSFTDTLGLTLEHACTTNYWYGTDEHWITYDGSVGTFKQYECGTGGWMFMERIMGISKPTLTLRPFRGFSVRRGLAAISLLLQQLK